MQFQAKENGEMVDMGGVGDERIARLVWLGYLGGKNVSSESARKGVVDGLVHLVEACWDSRDAGRMSYVAID